MNYQNLNNTISYTSLKKLQTKQVKLNAVLNPDRIKSYQSKNGELSFSYAAALLNDEIITSLQNLVEEQGCVARYKQILAGEVMNPGEKRKVLHHQTRSKVDRGFYGQEQVRYAEFAEKVRAGEIKGFSGKLFDTVVQIGIGGSDLGPRAMYLALERYVKANTKNKVLTAKFIANVDPDDANYLLNNIDIETTLFIVVSKSGITQETLTNLAFVKQKALNAGIPKEKLNEHFVAVTGKGSPLDDPGEYLASFYIDDNIGGRYSSTSAVAGVLLSVAFGADIFESFLQGAADIDEASLEPDITKNIALMAAAIGVWERNFLGYTSKAIIPYSEALNRFTAHLQQLDCESNGKSVDTGFNYIPYNTGLVIWGEPGTNGQHSFFQKLHQGTDIIPVQFIGFRKPQIAEDLEVFGSTSQQKLKANLVAQITALALGKTADNKNKEFKGNRPTTLIFADQLTPRVLGSLLAFYENIVMFQGFIWNINSFDQEGVQLGKVLAKEVLNQQTSLTNPVLQEFVSLLD